MKHIPKVLACALAPSFVAAACGDGDDDTVSGNPERNRATLAHRGETYVAFLEPQAAAPDTADDITERDAATAPEPGNAPPSAAPGTNHPVDVPPQAQ